MNSAASARSLPRAVYHELVSMDVFDLVARMTLLLLILYAGSYWYIHVPMTVVCVCGLLTPLLYRSSLYWFALTLVMGFGNAMNWYSIDNHKYLMTYWCLALSVALSYGERAPQVLASNARLLIGLCFAFAVLWKALLSSDFLDGSFFLFTLLEDSRFEEVARLLGGVTIEDQIANAIQMSDLCKSELNMTAVQLYYPQRLMDLAIALTWSSVVLELLVAVAFLCPAIRRLYAVRDWLLILFAVTTYAIATVAGFGWLLVIMGCAQCDPQRRVTRVSYVFVFFLIQMYSAPWKGLLPS